MNLSNLKIGILFTAYNCADYINDCFKPWFNLKNTFNFKFAINSGMFKMYKDLGFPDRNSETLNILYNYRFDFLINTRDSVLLDEDSSRNNCLNYLKDVQGCDLIWLVDADEVYTESQIINTIEYIRKNNSVDYYNTYFKNFTFLEKYHLEFDRPNIYWCDRNGGIDKFHFDSHVLYKDGTLYHQRNGITIPKSILFIDHYSWLTKDTRSKEKIDYQKRRHHGNLDTRCSYTYSNNELYFNKNFYDQRNLNYPVLHEFLYKIDNRFTFNYIFKEKKLILNSSDNVDSLKIEINDSENNNKLNWLISVQNCFTYWHIVDLDGIYRLKIYQNEILLHDENIFLNFRMHNYVENA